MSACTSLVGVWVRVLACERSDARIGPIDPVCSYIIVFGMGGHKKARTGRAWLRG